MLFTATNLHSKAAIDHSRRFIPESFTPLYHTECYHELREVEQLRYNQLHACYFNEQIIFFETNLARNVLSAFLKKPISAKLKDGLRQFIAEEERHSEMFRRLNQLSEPQFYRDSDLYFIRVPPVGARLLDTMTRRPETFPLFLWLMLLQEERAMYYAKGFLAEADDLDPQFVATQRLHLADEVGHVRWDEELLDLVWPQTKPWLRRLNVRLLGWMLNEYFGTPKRAGLRVLRQLAREFPSLQERLPAMENALLSLADNPQFLQSLYSREIVPKVFSRFDDWPEFSLLQSFASNQTAKAFA